MKNNLISLLFLLITLVFCAQENRNTWQIGLGTSATMFSDEDASFIGDKYLFQIPRLNLTMPINKKLSVDGALSFNTIDNFSLIQNSVSYFSADASLRYNFSSFFDNFYPYVFVGGSIVDSERKATPTLNAGLGGTYWFTDKWGVNSQLYYKHSFKNYESMRSHLQGTLGIVYSLDWDNLFGSRRGGSSSKPCLD